MLRNFGVLPIFQESLNRPFLLTRSKALVRSINITYRTIDLVLYYLELTKGEDHVGRQSAASEATLGLWVNVVHEQLQFIDEDAGIPFTNDSLAKYSIVVAEIALVL